MIGCTCPVCKSADPRDNRLRTSALVEHNGFRILIDCGPDFRQQMLRENISDLDAVILTHQHKDHTGGMDDIRAFNYFRKEAFPIYAERNVQDSLKMEYSYAFAEYKYPGVPEYKLHTIDANPFTVSKVLPDGNTVSLTITPIRVYHYMLPILGFRFGNMAYITKMVVQLMRDLGSIPAPQNCFLLNIGLENLLHRIDFSKRYICLCKLTGSRFSINDTIHKP